MTLKIDYTHLSRHLGEHEIDNYAQAAATALRQVREKNGPGADFLGWVELPKQISAAQIDGINQLADDIRSHSDTLVSIGIGGSYLGARAVIEALQGADNRREKPEILFAGHHLSARATKRLLTSLEDREVSLNVISKSGTTTEPGIAFRLLRRWLETRYGDQAARRIIATTDKSRGALKKLATEQGYKTLVIPDDVGGRFSVLTPVGLLPLAVAGIDIAAFVRGFQRGYDDFLHKDAARQNPAIFYALTRSLLGQKGFTTEVLANFEPDLHNLAEWWKQLFGESEGKDGRGIFPAAVDFTTDLHSLGQFLQDGRRNLFETFIMIEDTQSPLQLEEDRANLDGLNYLSSLQLEEINRRAYQATADAHASGGVPNMTLWLPALDAENLGLLMYFFEISIAVSGYLAAVNPFDQPGVEAYKTNMFQRLGKPGFALPEKAAADFRIIPEREA
jgi:glucose-6-phosphate isomerase